VEGGKAAQIKNIKTKKEDKNCPLLIYKN